MLRHSLAFMSSVYKKLPHLYRYQLFPHSLVLLQMFCL
uniref:Uncharacterized protein n=1 Tax=Anguilla anguilla TaxID=7936 RepID=A0A0E9SK60_ANGAN